MSTHALPLLEGGSAETGLGNRGPESKSIVVPYGFWLFILSDIILFSTLFASYAVLVHATDGGPSGRDLFDLRNVAIETVALLVSSFVCGLALIAARRRNMLWTQVWLLVIQVLTVLMRLSVQVHTMILPEQDLQVTLLPLPLSLHFTRSQMVTGRSLSRILPHGVAT